MTSALLLSTLLLATSAAPSRGRPAPTFEAGRREFKRGDYVAALRVLDAAAGDTSEAQALSKIHLLRGQCFAAQQDFSRAEEAFDLSLENDPEAGLDPAKVDPSLVKMLDGLRGRLRGELSVRADRPGASVLFDGKPIGSAPLKAQVPIGRHTLFAKTADGRFGVEREVVVRARRDNPVELALVEIKSPPPTPDPATSARRPVADVRPTFEPVQWREGPGFEVGGGLEQGPYRVTGHVRLFPEFGLAVRGALLVPVMDKLSALIEVELPVVFLQYPAVGFGGSAGVEYFPSKWFSVFGQLGAKHYFSGTGGYERNRLPTIQAGIRLRPP
ncbi:MAG: PEGA domain-containing protein [Myxococcaceae bacterium]